MNNAMQIRITTKATSISIAPPKKLPLVSQARHAGPRRADPGHCGRLVFPEVRARSSKSWAISSCRLIKAGVAPLVFLTHRASASLRRAMSRASDGSAGARSLYFEVVSTIALMFGLLAGNLLRIGKGMAPSRSARRPAEAAKAAPQGFAAIRHAHRARTISSARSRKGELLQVLVLAVMFGIGILAFPSADSVRINDGLDHHLGSAVLRFIHIS